MFIAFSEDSEVLTGFFDDLQGFGATFVDFGVANTCESKDVDFGCTYCEEALECPKACFELRG